MDHPLRFSNISAETWFSVVWTDFFEAYLNLRYSSCSFFISLLLWMFGNKNDCTKSRIKVSLLLNRL